jgi:aerobic carbon-monoxide dehydrogenase large subunit
VSRLVGASVVRVEDARILAGKGRYVDDIRLPGMVHAAFVRSTVAHGMIRSVDTSEARAVPGVLAVLTATDLDGIVGPIMVFGPPGYGSPAFSALASDKVRCVGDPVAVVVATSRYAAEDGCEAVIVDIEPLPALAATAAALAARAPEVFAEYPGNVVFRDVQRYGDPDAAFVGAHLVIDETFRQHRHANVPMEGHGAIADWEPATGDLTFWASHQGPHGLRFGLAMALQIPFDRVQVRCGDVGGAFGQKGSVNREDLALCAASRLLGRPVKWIADRYENLVAGGQAREEDLRVRAAVDADGRILAVKVDMVMDHGAYPVNPVPATVFAACVRVLFPSAYRIEHLEFATTIVATNKASYVAYRGPWEVETWVRESLLDTIARAVGTDPLSVRRVNLLSDAELPRDMITGPTLDRITVGRCLDAVADAIDIPAFRAEQAAALAEGRYLGLGLSAFIEPAPGPPNWGPSIGFPMPPEPARARLQPDGRVTVFTQQLPHGQGHETTLAQVAADALGVPIDHVRVVSGDTAVTPFSLMGTGGSRSARMATGAVTGAVRDLRAKIAEVAAHMLEANADDIEITDAMVGVRGVPARSIPLAQLALGVAAGMVALPPGTDTHLEAYHVHDGGDGGWAQAAHGCIVEVDVATGLARIVRYVVVEDCGRIINPTIVDGQVAGGVVQGIGAVLLEHSAYGTDGQPLATTFMDYLLPTACDVPLIEIHHLETPGLHELDFRGAGEGGAVAAPAAVTNAIADALAPLGVAIRQQHLPPDVILDLLAAAAEAAPTATSTAVTRSG